MEGTRGEWLEVRLRVPPEALEAVSNLLHEHGLGGVVIDDEEAAQLRAYLPVDPRLQARRAALRSALGELVAFFPGMAEWQEESRVVREEDWATAWRAHFHPVRLGRRLVVSPTWETPRVRPGEVVLRIDPGMAFGTGTHPSTVLCLEALEELVEPGRRVVDVGTGSGILAIAAARLGAGAVTALDVDPLAVRIARENVAQNGVAGLVRVLHAELPELLARGLEPAEVLVANLTAELVVELAPHLAAALRPGGTAVVSGLVASGEPRVTRALGAAGLRVGRVTRREDWVALWARAPAEGGA